MRHACHILHAGPALLWGTNRVCKRKMCVFHLKARRLILLHNTLFSMAHYPATLSACLDSSPSIYKKKPSMQWASAAAVSVWGCEYFPLISVLLYRAIDPALASRLRRYDGDGRGRQTGVPSQRPGMPRSEKKTFHLRTSIWGVLILDIHDSRGNGGGLCSEMRRQGQNISVN